MLLTNNRSYIVLFRLCAVLCEFASYLENTNEALQPHGWCRKYIRYHDWSTVRTTMKKSPE